MSRRRLLVASSATLAAGAPLALAACGTAEDEADSTAPEREAELLGEVLAGQLAVVQAADLASSNAPRQAQPALDRINTLRQQSSRALARSIAELEGEPTREPAAIIGAESAVEGAARQLEASIATSLDAIGELTTDAYRQAVHRTITEDAAALAALRDVLGEDPSPDAFVMGPSTSPKEAE